MSPLRILHVVPYYEHAWAYGGIPRVATTLTHGLARRGHHVTVCTTDACDARARTSQPLTAHTGPGALDVHIARNLSNYLAYRWQIFAPLALAQMVRSVLRHIDIAHLHACRNLPVATAARILTKARIPYIVSPHGTAPLIERRFLAKQVFDATAGRGYLERAARVLAVSDAEQQQFAALGIPDARVTLLPNPIDEREFDPAPDGLRFRTVHGLREAPLVLLLAKLTPRKGARTLLRAFSKIARTDAKLVVAGSDMRSGVASAALAGNPRVRHVGLLKGRDRLDALAAANVVVYPSRHEVFGLVPLEALLSGSPVVVCNDSGAGEIIGTVGGGHIVPPGDDESLAGAIDAILAANSLWRQRARTAAVRVRQHFGSDLICERLEALYRDVIGRSVEEDQRSA